MRCHILNCGKRTQNEPVNFLSPKVYALMNKCSSVCTCCARPCQYRKKQNNPWSSRNIQNNGRKTSKKQQINIISKCKSFEGNRLAGCRRPHYRSDLWAEVQMFCRTRVRRQLGRAGGRPQWEAFWAGSPQRKDFWKDLSLTRVTGTIKNSNLKDQNQEGLADPVTSNTRLEWVKGCGTWLPGLWGSQAASEGHNTYELLKTGVTFWLKRHLEKSRDLGSRRKWQDVMGCGTTERAHGKVWKSRSQEWVAHPSRGQLVACVPPQRHNLQICYLFARSCVLFGLIMYLYVGSGWD